jgi:hypothetical protein
MINPNDYPKFDLGDRKWFDDQVFVDGDCAWRVPDLWELSADLPIHEVPLVGMNLDLGMWDDVGTDFLEFCKHANLVNKADLKYPILLAPLGYVIDGRHRLAKAIIKGHKTIKVQRLLKMPEPDYRYDEEGNSI